MSDQYRDVELALVDSSRRAGTQHASPPVLPRRRRGYLARALLILVLGAGWFVGLRPYLHGLAQNQIDKVLSNVVNQIALTPISMLPSGPTSLPVTEMTSKGQLQLTNVTVEGIFSLIMSSGEIAPTLNAHLRDARAKLHRSIVGVVLKDHEMDIMLS